MRDRRSVLLAALLAIVAVAFPNAYSSATTSAEEAVDAYISALRERERFESLLKKPRNEEQQKELMRVISDQSIDLAAVGKAKNELDAAGADAAKYAAEKLTSITASDERVALAHYLRKYEAYRKTGIDVLIDEMVHSEDPDAAAKAEALLENVAIPYEFTDQEVATLAERVRTVDDVLRAGRLTRILGHMEAVDPAKWAPAAVERFQREVNSEKAPPNFGGGLYVSPRVYILNQFLLGFQHAGPPAIPPIAQAVVQTEELDWLNIARGMAGDASAAEAVKRIIESDAEPSMRCVAVRAYGYSAGKEGCPICAACWTILHMSHGATCSHFLMWTISST